MATVGSSSQRDNYIRLCLLLIDEGTTVLQDVLNATLQSCFPNKTFSDVLNIGSVQCSLKQAGINKQQKRMLFPQHQLQNSKKTKAFPGYGKSDPNLDIKQLDITLLCTLLKYISPHLLNYFPDPENPVWDNPQPTDLSTAANIGRLRNIRNEVYGHCSTAQVPDADFEKHWEDIVRVLCALSNGKSQKYYIGLKYSPIDSRLAEKYIRMLEMWYHESQYNEESLDQIQRDLAEKPSVEDMQQIVSEEIEPHAERIINVIQAGFEKVNRNIKRVREISCDATVKRLKLGHNDEEVRKTQEQLTSSQTMDQKPHDDYNFVGLPPAQSFPSAATVETSPFVGSQHMDLSETREADYVDRSDDDLGMEDMQLENEEELELRNYQHELAEPALRGNNTVICAPTGSGKTHVAMYIVKRHLSEGLPGEHKVVFLVNSVPLVDQQYKQFRRYLSQYNCKRLHGDMDDCARGYFKGIAMKHDIIIMTAQILVNALKFKTIDSISLFSLLVFDECHHTQSGHAYNVLMNFYLQEKIDKRPQLPQIVGLTASVGVGKAKNVGDATEHILKLCGHLDCEELSTVDIHQIELEDHVNIPKEVIEHVPGRQRDTFVVELSSLMDQIQKRMCDEAYHVKPSEIKDLYIRLLALSPEKGNLTYTSWIQNLKKDVSRIYDQKRRRLFVASLDHLKRYNDALYLSHECRNKDALGYLEEEFAKQSRDHYDETDHWLEEIYKEKNHVFKIAATSGNDNNPKLERLKTAILLQAFTKNPETYCIVFVKLRALTRYLQDWMLETPELKQYNPGKIVGSNDRNIESYVKTGMSKQAQSEVLDYFREGNHRILVATSVIEEGLDVRTCNRVIRYGYVTNEISMVQSKAHQESINIEKQILMEKAIHRIKKDMGRDEFKHKVAAYQEHVLQEAKARKNKHRHMHTDDDVQFRCFKCNHRACWASDFKKIDDSHHAVVDTTFRERCIVEHTKKEYRKDCEVSRLGKVYCIEYAIKTGEFYHYINIRRFQF